AAQTGVGRSPPARRLAALAIDDRAVIEKRAVARHDLHESGYLRACAKSGTADRTLEPDMVACGDHVEHGRLVTAKRVHDGAQRAPRPKPARPPFVSGAVMIQVTARDQARALQQ